MNTIPVFYAGLYDSRRNTPAGHYLITAWNAWRRGNKKPPYLPQGCSVIIDCGAYGAYVKGVPLPFTEDEYVEFIRYVQTIATVDAAATIDVMDDREASEANARSIIQKYPDIPWIATAHGNTDKECAESAAYLETLNPAFIGVGCATVAKRGGVEAVIARVKAVAEAAPSKKLHLWGVGLKRAEALRHPSVASHDVSSWYPRTSNGSVREALKTWDGSLSDYVYVELALYRQKLAELLT